MKSQSFAQRGWNSTICVNSEREREQLHSNGMKFNGIQSINISPAASQMLLLWAFLCLLYKTAPDCVLNGNGSRGRGEEDSVPSLQAVPSSCY